MQTQVTRVHGTFGRWAGWSGILFVALLVVALFSGLAPTYDTSQPEVIDEITRYLADESNRTTNFLSALLVIIGGIFFLFFLVGLWMYLIQAEDRPAPFSTLCLAGGIVMIILLMAGAASANIVGAAASFSDAFEPDPHTAILFHNLWWWLFGFAAAGAGAMLWGASIVGRRTGILPRWLTWGGLVVGSLCPLSVTVFHFPLALALVWMIIVSIRFIRLKSI